MNVCRRILRAALWLAPLAASAQTPSSTHSGINAAVIQLFSDFPAFSAQAQVRLLDKNQKESMRMSMHFSLGDGKVRAEVNLGQIQSAQMPPQVAANLKQMGMDHMITIVRPDLASTLVVYPALKAYAATALSSTEIEDMTGRSRIVKKLVGQDTVDGHPCEKCQVTVTPPNGQPREALVWYATDMKRFPVQVQMAEEGSVVIMLYQGVRLEKPAANLFEVPAGFAKHASVEQLMQSAMTRMFDGQK